MANQVKTDVAAILAAVEAGKSKSIDWTKLLLIGAVAWLGYQQYTGGPGSPPVDDQQAAPINSSTRFEEQIAAAFPGGGEEARQWHAALVQFGACLERDGAKQWPAILDTAAMHREFAEVQRSRAGLTGEQSVWPPEYDGFKQVLGNELIRRLGITPGGEAVSLEGDQGMARRRQARAVLTEAAHALEGKI